MTKNANQKKAEFENKPNPTDVLIAEELKEWQKRRMMPVGIPPQLMGQIPGIGVDAFKMDQMIVTMFEVLVEQLELDVEEVNEKFRQKYLNKLRALREEAEQHSHIAVPSVEVPPSLIISENIRRKMH